METLRTLRRSTRLCLHSGFVRWRWALLIAVFFLSALLVTDILRHTFSEYKVGRPVDVWDLYPALLSHTYSLHFLYAFGFLVLVGDQYHRQRDQGTATLFATRMPSRTTFWLGNVAAVGIMALAFASLSFVISFLIGLILTPPSTLWPMLPRETLSVLSIPVTIPLPIYSLLLVLYTAWGLWIGGATILLLSAFFRNTAIVLAGIAAWIFVSLGGTWELSSPYMRFFCIGYLINQNKHFDEWPMSMGSFFTMSTLMLVVITLVGAWRMEREEI